MTDKYLQNYTEPEARSALAYKPLQRWQHVLVIPAYRESRLAAQRLQQLAGRQAGLLVILVLNRPSSDCDEHCNDTLRSALLEFPLVDDIPDIPARLLQLADTSHLLLVERAQALPPSEGVGLARKIGCDLALALVHNNAVERDWLYSSDADAILPSDYFEAGARAGHAVAMTFAFHHTLPDEPRHRLAMCLYELRLHYYVLGLQKSGSPYAFHTLGSCLALRATAYARVRGFPKRAGAEDFYLLNKVAKLGRVERAGCEPLLLEPRLSDRVPFGTGPALEELCDIDDMIRAPLFYHPHSFTRLGQVLAAAEDVDDPSRATQALQRALGTDPLVMEVLNRLGIDKFLRHAETQSRDYTSFRRHFMQWFDGFRSLKFIHALRAEGCSDLDLRQSLACNNNPWPVMDGPHDPESLLRCTRAAAAGYPPGWPRVGS